MYAFKSGNFAPYEISGEKIIGIWKVYKNKQKMKVNRVYKTVRPMRKFGNLIKDLLMPEKSNHFWIRVHEKANTRKEKENQIFAIIELLNNRIKINEH